MLRKSDLLASLIAIILSAGLLGGICRAQLFDPPAGSLDQEITRLTAVLQSDAPIHEKGQACKRLAFLGDKRCVPPLAELLGDERLSHFARYGLETIPDPAVDKALRVALSSVEGRQLIGVVNSIGVRRDRGAINQLGNLLKGPDDDVAAAAAAALAHIATPEAAHLLAKGIAKDDGARRPALCDASLHCAERLAEHNQMNDARRIYESLFDDGLPRPVRLAAALGMLRTEPEATASQRFSEYLASQDDVKFEAAVYASAEREDRGITRALAAAMKGAAEQRQVQLLDAMRARRDAEVVPQIAAAFENGPPQVRVAALVSLGLIGDRTSVPLLISAATSQNAQVAAAAVESLSKLHGEKVDEALLEQLSKSGYTCPMHRQIHQPAAGRCPICAMKLEPARDSARQRVVVTVLGRRSVAAAAPALVALLSSADPATRVAALEALGQTIGEKEFPALLDRIPAAKNEAERDAAVAAVDAAGRRMPSADAVVQAVAERNATWPEEHRPALLNVLGAVGGEKALAIVAAAAVDGSLKLQDAATRELGRWMTPDAAPYLYRIAASDDHPHKTRALRGYLRIARQLNLPDAERLEMCRKALAIADRPDERELALEVMERCPSAEAVELASSLLDDAELRQRAVETAVFIGEKIKETDPAAAKSAGQKALDAEPSGDLADRARALVSPQ